MERIRCNRWRYDAVFGLLMLAVVGLCVRLAVLVGFPGAGGQLSPARAEALRLTERQQRMVIPLPARPGNIFARARSRYVLLAGSKQVPSCYVDPFILRDDELAEAAVAVGRALGADPVQIQQTFISRRRARFVWLKRNITDQEARAVRAMGIPAIGVTYEWRRHYPNAQLASTVVGFRLFDGRGGGGLELSQHHRLTAQPGKRVVLADAFRRPIWPLPERSSPPRDGQNVFLSLDIVIQGYLQHAVQKSVEQFDAEWGTGVIVNPQSGEVLAMCSVPAFDPNAFNTTTAERRTNRAISVPYEPGSVIKPIFAAAAVDAGLLTYETRIFCENGTYRARRGGRISDHGKSYGELSVADVVVLSSNIGMAKVGEKLGNERIFTVARKFGFGRRTGVKLPGESGGIVRPLRVWDGYSTRRVPFGQEISVTALQLTMAFGSLVNGGLLLQPQLVDHVRDASGRVVWTRQPQVVRRVLSPAVAARTLNVLQQVVQRGTGKACRLERWSSFGKTGTAQVPGAGGYIDEAYTATFIGGAPAGRPKVLCLISIYRPDKSKGYYGSKVAAPYVKEVLRQTLSYMNVPADRPVWAGKPSGPSRLVVVRSGLRRR